MRKFLLLSALVALLPSMLQATVKHPVPQASAAPEVGQTYYLYNVKHNAFLMPGEAWHTRVGTSYVVGWPFKWVKSSEDGWFNLQSLKNGNPVYMKCGDMWAAWYDGASDEGISRYQIEAVDGKEATYYFHLQNVPTQYCFYRASGWNDRAIQSWTGSSNEDCQWQFISEVDYQAYMKAMDAYASAYTANMDACITHYGNMWTLAAHQQGDASWTPNEGWGDGYRSNGITNKVDGTLRVTTFWNDCYVLEEFVIMPAGDYTFSVEATKIDGFPSSGPWVNTFAASNATVSNRWKAEPGAAGFLGKANNFGDVNFTYDPTEGPLGVGIRSWGLAEYKSVWGVDLKKFHLTWKGTGKYTVSVGATCYATLFLPYAVTIPEGITACTGTINPETGKLTLTPLEDGVIPAETAVVLKATAAGDYTFTKTTAEAFSGKNDLLGDINKTAQNGTDKYYVLANNGEIGFYALSDAVPGFKAYLKVPAAAGVKAFTFGDTATGVELTTDNGQQTTEIFNLSGQRLQKAQKGINIINGKKYLK